LDSTGVDYTTAPSGVGNAIELIDNDSVTISGAHIQTMAENGIRSIRTDATVSGCTILNCGSSAINGQRNGIYSSGGFANVAGCRIGSTGGASHEYALQADDGTRASITSCDLRGNVGTGGPNRFFANAASAIVANNRV
jgi:hypothetical protein